MPGGGSSVYVLPLSGGEPKLLTEQTPSYWHGWNPNNKEVCFVAQRGSRIYNLYKMDINGGKEIQLTFNTKVMSTVLNILRTENLFTTMRILRVRCRSGG